MNSLQSGTPGEFVDPHTVVLRSGQRITEVRLQQAYPGHGFCTGWLSGCLYVSRDYGKTWQPSDLAFRVA